MAMRSFLEDRGIKQSFSPAYSPAQNAIAARLNRTIVEEAQSFMTHAGLPFSFSAEVAVHTAEIRNHFFGPGRSPKSSLELSTGIKP